MGLRPYQQAALEAVRESYREGHKDVLVVMPTGTGKTVLFAEISRLAKGPVLVVAHRQELVEQAREKISAWCDDVVAVEMASQRGLTALTQHGGTRPKITVASVQSLTKRLDKVPRDAFRILVIDEAHHSTADSYRTLIDHFQAYVLGVTATPDRGDRQRLGDVFSAVAFDYGMVQAIDEGWLCPVRSFLVQTQLDFSGIRKVAGELATGDVEKILTEELHLAEIARPIVEERGDRPAMVFSASVAHAHSLSRVLCDLAGDPNYAAALDGASPFDIRRDTIDRFKRGDIKVLVNCALFTEGFDVPQVAMVAIARPVLSRAFYAQMVGRGTRIAPGKKDLLVLDFVPANCRHSLVQAVDIFAVADAEVVEAARQIAAERSAEGEAIALEQALELARQIVEAREASVEYQLMKRDPFAAVGIHLDGAMRKKKAPAQPRDGDVLRVGGATTEQVAYLSRAGLPIEQVRKLSAPQAEAIRERLLERKAVGLCSPKQARELCALGVDGEHMYRDEAQAILAWVRKNKHRPREELVAAIAAGAVESASE